LLFLIIFSNNADAQLRNYGLVYSDNAKGDVVTFGNTLMTLGLWGTQTVDASAVNDNSLTGNTTFTNNYQNMLAVDVDGNTAEGAVTRNSSTADLSLPAGTNTIRMARLYWGGRSKRTDYDLSLPWNRTIKVRKGTSGTYLEYAAQQFDQHLVNSGTADEFTLFQGYVDVTEFVRNNGAGTYSVGNAPLSTGDGGNAGNYGGWCIVVVYENQSLPFNSIRVYDGFQEVWSFGTPLVSTVTLSGLDVPSGALALEDAKMSMVAWEGDANFKQDFLKINNATFSNSINPADNPMNGTISRFGSHVTTKNPNYTNQFGIDIDEFYVGQGFNIQPNSSSITLQFGTELDQYFPGLFTFVIKMKEPTVSLEKTVTDASGDGVVEANEILTYTLRGRNTGVGNANNIILVDTLASSITYIPNSLEVLYSPGLTAGIYTDNSGDDIAEYIVNGVNKTVRFRLGTGANTTSGGIIGGADSFIVRFQVRVNAPASGETLTPIINIARLQARSDANELFVDDGIAIITPAIINLPVVMSKFNATLQANNVVAIQWTTEQEINTNRFLIERSSDGQNFSSIGQVSAAGFASQTRNYQWLDQVGTISTNWVYYRIKQFDNDGKWKYSTIVAVKLKKGTTQFTVSPNPFRNLINVNFDWQLNETGTISIINYEGQQIMKKQIQLMKGANFIQLNELNKLNAGNYLVRIQTSAQVIIKQISKY
jgi:uncharacterized repeat protein (TIGR01451 family)